MFSLSLIYNDTPANHADILTWSHINKEESAQTVTRNACHRNGPFPSFCSQNEGHPHGKCGWYFNYYWMFPFIVLDTLIFHNMSQSRNFSWPLITSSIVVFIL